MTDLNYIHSEEKNMDYELQPKKSKWKTIGNIILGAMLIIIIITVAFAFYGLFCTH